MTRSLEHAEAHEALRLKAVAELDTEAGPEECFDRIARLVRETLSFPASLVSLIDGHRHIFKSVVPGGACFGDLQGNFCAIAVRGNDPLIVLDATAEAPFNEFSVVVGQPHIRAYWGVPLRTGGGYNVGTLSVMDVISRSPSERDIRLLHEYAAVAVELLELRAHATIDVLTGINNRRVLYNLGEKLVTRSLRIPPAKAVCPDLLIGFKSMPYVMRYCDFPH